MPSVEGSRFVEISFPDEATVVRARLLDDLAPQTCEAIWSLAALSPELRGVHAAFTGRELSVPVPAHFIDEMGGIDIPMENGTLFPIPGDLVWAQLPAYAWTGVKEPLYDLGIFYGRDSRLLLPVGWVTGNRFGEVVPEHLPELATLCARTQLEGAKRVILRRSAAEEEESIAAS